MSEHITVGELCARHIGRQVILSRDGEVHQIAGRQVLLIGITHMLADQTCTCIAWPCERGDRHPGFLGIEGQHEHVAEAVRAVRQVAEAGTVETPAVVS